MFYMFGICVCMCPSKEGIGLKWKHMRISDNKTDFLLTYISKTLPVLPINGVLLFKINDYFIFFFKIISFQCKIYLITYLFDSGQ